MQITDAQVKLVQEQIAKSKLVAEIQEMDLPLESYPRPEDAEMMARVVKSVAAMPDREDRIAELKARIDAGTYNVTGDEIADAMIRRSIADKMR